MSEKKFTIDIDTTADTTGAKETEKALEHVSEEARRTERELGALETGAKRVDEELARTGNTSEGVSAKLGGRLKGNIQSAGYQIQDFAVQVGGGTSALTAFGQQAPQFLGAFGPAGSIAGAIVAIGAVAANAFMKMGDDAGTAKKATEDLTTTFSHMLKVYKEFEDLGKDDREKATQDLAAGLKKSISGIDNKFKVSLGITDLEAARANAAAQLQLAKEKLELASTESALVTATGKDFLRLSKEREATIHRIYLSELAIAEVARVALVNKAQAKVDAATGKVDAVGTVDTALAGQYAALKSTIAGLLAEADSLRDTRVFNANQLADERAALTAQIKALQKDLVDRPNISGVDDRTFQIKQAGGGVESLSKRIADPGTQRQEAELIAQATAKENTLGDLKSKLDASAVAQLEAAKSLTQATLDLKNLKETQGIARQSEADQKVVTDTGAAEQKIRDAGEATAKQISGALTDALKDIGKAADSPEVKTITARITDLSKDGVQKSEQNEVFVLFQQLIAKSTASNLQNKQLLDKVIGIIDTSISGLAGVKARLDEQGRILTGIQNQLSSPNP